MNKKFKDLIPGNSLFILCIDPETNEASKIMSCIVDKLNDSKTILGVRYVNPENKNEMIVGHFRVNPESYINDSLKEDKEHRVMALFETKDAAVENYIKYCEDKIETYKNNINKISKLV